MGKTILRNGGEDLELWLKVKTGDQSAFEQLYKYYVKILYNYGMKLCGDAGLVEDSIQDIFVAIWQSRDNLVFTTSIKRYLLKSFRRSLLRKLQQNRTINLTDDLFFDLESVQNEKDEEDFNSKNLKIASIKEAINHLPKRQREAIYLKYFENLDSEEIASIMSIQITAVYKLVSVGIKKLRVISSDNKY